MTTKAATVEPNREQQRQGLATIKEVCEFLTVGHVTVYDTLGNEHVMNMYFVKADAPVNTWNTYVTVDNLPANPGGGAPGAEGAAPAPAAEGAAATPATPTGTLVGTLTFNSTGGLAATNPASTPLGIMSIPGGIVFANGSSTPQEMTMDFNMSTQFGAPFGVTALNQNGYTSGQLNGFSTSAESLQTLFIRKVCQYNLA